MKKVTLIYIWALISILIAPIRTYSQINGPDTVNVGQITSYSYTANPSQGPSMVWSVGYRGQIQGTYQGVLSVYVKWLTPGEDRVIVNYSGGQLTKYVYIVQVPVVPGTVYPSTQSVPDNKRPQRISAGLPSGGSCMGNYTYQWQISSDNLSFTDYPGNTLELDPLTLSASRYFRLKVECSGEIAYTESAYVHVYPRLKNNTITSAITDSIAWNTAPPSITGSTPVDGNCNSVYTYQWEYSIDGNTFANVPANGTGINYQPSNLARTTYYRRRVTCGADVLYSGILTVPVKKVAFAPGIIAKSQVIRSGTIPTTITATVATGGTAATFGYQWQRSVDEIKWVDIANATALGYAPGALSRTTYYRRRATNGEQTGFSNVIFIKTIAGLGNMNIPGTDTIPIADPGVTPLTIPTYVNESLTSANVNFVRTWDVTKPGVNTIAAVKQLTAAIDYDQTTVFYDGIGNTIQSVAKQQSPMLRDFVTVTTYDSVGRVAQQFLPYIDAGTATGEFKTGNAGKQSTFYNNLYNNKEGYYYSNTLYEPSPEGRVLKQTKPGKGWAGNERGIRTMFAINGAADSVRLWTIGLAGNNLPVSNKYYATEALMLDITVDENENRTITYMDNEGKMILKKVQRSDFPSEGHTGWLCTYYVYDVFDRLRFVIPPKAVELIRSNWGIDPGTARELCFSYRYDERGRMIVKKIPGADSVEMVYDTRDRLVFRQDGSMKVKNQWQVTFYDGLNRPTMTALYNLNTTRNALQTSMNAAVPGTQTITYPIPEAADLVIASHDGRPTYTARGSITFDAGFDTGTGETLAEINGAAYQDTISIIATNPLPNITVSSLVPLTYTFYDDYSYSGKHDPVSSDFTKPQYNGSTYAQVVTTASNMARGRITGSKVRVLGTDQWLTTSTYYTNNSRVLQTVANNSSGGKDATTFLYDFSGKLLSTYLSHRNLGSGVSPQTTVMTQMLYDVGGRLAQVIKELNGNSATRRTIAQNTYDELGRLQTKRLNVSDTSQLETLNYEYNVHGWLKSINKSFVNTNNSTTNWFGEELSYDYGFAGNQYNGNVAGAKWKSQSAGIARAFGYIYDNVSRLIIADFTQRATSGGNWNHDQTDYSVSGLTYDENGNILSMRQRGMSGILAKTIDSLKYGYFTNSNKLSYVTDKKNDSQSLLGDFKEINNNETADYAYDSSGNLIKDLNKNIVVIHYNHLNLPDSIDIVGKGSIRYQYDAVGNKLKKIVNDNTTSSAKITTTDYMGEIVYRNDTMELISHEEGRIRPVFQSGQPVKYYYDYFLKDHIGNVRMVLTEQPDLSVYTATMEASNAATETALFSNVEETRAAKPVGYPEDQTTSSNEYVAKLNAKDGGKKIGPSLVLKVMVGDTIQIGVRTFYKSTGPKDNKSITPDDMVAGLLQAFGSDGTFEGSHAIGQADRVSPFVNFNSNDYQRLKEKDPDQNRQDKPKAYLNFVLFDDQFNLVEENSGVRQVKGEPDELQTLSVDKMVMRKSGFLYIYTSNETAQDVFFDNVTVVANNGPLLEETHYYPFGLIMAGISSNALRGTSYQENRKKFNGIEHTTDLGQNQYDAFYRTLDPQLGRWWQIDPRAEYFEDVTPYNHVLNNPINMSDPFGDDTVHVNDLPNVWPDFDPTKDVVKLNGITVTPQGTHQSNSYFTAMPGYKVLPGLNFWGRLWHPYRKYPGGGLVDGWGHLTWTRGPTAGMPSGFASAGSPGGGPNLIKIGNTLRRVIANLKWSSKSVNFAAKLLKSGVKEVTVKNRAEAEEILRKVYMENGYTNATGVNPEFANNYLGSQGYYHWDDVFDETGRLIGHGPDNPHALIKHLQIHTEEGDIIRIFFN